MIANGEPGDRTHWPAARRSWWQGLRRFGRIPPLASTVEFQRFVNEQAGLVAQKSAIDYCRGKTGMFSFALFEEKAFIDALAVCRWETFAEAVGDILILAESVLRADVGPAQPRLVEGLAAIYPTILAAYPLPAHRPHGWDDAVTGFRRKLEFAVRAPPRHSAEIAMPTARRLFETLPIHMSMRTLDEEIVHGSVCFRMVSVHQDLEKHIDGAALIRDLIGDGGL